MDGFRGTLEELREELGRRAERVAEAMKNLDFSRTTRTARHPFERAWLVARGMQGPWQEVTTTRAERLAEEARLEGRFQARLALIAAEARSAGPTETPPARVQAARSTTEPGFLDFVDLIGRGGTADWQDLYARAKADPALRRQIRDALPLVDPEIGEGRALWTVLLDRLDQLDPTDGADMDKQPR